MNASRGEVVQVVSLPSRISASWVITVFVVLNSHFSPPTATTRNWCKLCLNSLPLTSHLMPGFSGYASLLFENQEEIPWREKQFKISGSPQGVSLLSRIFSSSGHLHIPLQSFQILLFYSVSLVFSMGNFVGSSLVYQYQNPKVSLLQYHKCFKL